MNDESNPYVAPTTTETTRRSSSLARLRGVGISLLWFGVAATAVTGRVTVVPIFEDFGAPLPIVALLAVSPWALIAALLVAVSVLLVAIVSPEHRKLRMILNFAFVFGVIVLAVFVAGLVLPVVSLFDSLSQAPGLAGPVAYG